MNIKNLKYPLYTIALVGLFLLAGHLEYKDQVAAEKYHCKMTSEAYWPNYDHGIDCSAINGDNQS